MDRPTAKLATESRRSLLARSDSARTTRSFCAKRLPGLPHSGNHHQDSHGHCERIPCDSITIAEPNRWAVGKSRRDTERARERCSVGGGVRPRGHPMSGATLTRRVPSAVRSDRVAPADRPKLPGDPPLRSYDLTRALVVIHQHPQLPVGSIPSSPQFVPPGRSLGRRVHRWPLRATSSIAERTA
jgi:hypothetical protein